MNQIPATELARRAFDDLQRETYPIKSVTRQADGWELQREDGWTVWASPMVEDHRPQVGDTVTTWGLGVGSPIRGIAVNDIVYRYQTEAEEREEHALWVLRRKAEQIQHYLDNHADLQFRVDALPDVFRERIAYFRSRSAEWRAEFEPYELTTCETAVQIAEVCPDRDAVQAFYDLSWEEQKAKIPALDEGLSGNMFGHACTLAAVFNDDPAAVPKMHGAMCALVGCEEYGCWASSDEARQERDLAEV